MLDHVFTDAIGALRDGFEDARLERLAPEEVFHTDLLAGDLTWKTSYGLPGEGRPANMCAGIMFIWSTWSQTAYRTWLLDGHYPEPPSLNIAIEFRIQNLISQPSPATVLASLPKQSPPIGGQPLMRSGPTITASYGHKLNFPLDYRFKVTYEGPYYLDDDRLADGTKLDKHFNFLGSWIASILVRLGDLKLPFGLTQKI